MTEKQSVIDRWGNEWVYDGDGIIRFKNEHRFQGYYCNSFEEGVEILDGIGFFEGMEQADE